MGRYTGPSCRLCRRAGEKLFLKGDRCFTPRCAIEKRRNPPGNVSRRRRRPSDSGVHLLEKQKAKYTYGVLEKQFSNLFKKASHKQGITGEVLLQLLEIRLDNTVFRLGIAKTRRAARQLVLHKHITVNGKVVNVPSYTLRIGDMVEVREKSKSLEVVVDSLALNSKKFPWLEWDSQDMAGKLVNLPLREDIPENIQEQLIVELYSK